MRSSIRFVHARAARWAGGAAFAVCALNLCRCGDGFKPTEESPADAGAEALADALVYVVPAPDGEARGPGADAGNENDAEAGDAAVACDPTRDPKDDPCVIDNAFAVFVAAPFADDAGTVVDGGTADGTKAHPATTIGQGLALATAQNRSRVYVCDGKYVESVDVASPVGLYGGFACAHGANGPVWSWVGGTVDVTAPSGGSSGSPAVPTYALSVHAPPSAPVTIEDMTLTAPDAVGTDAQGNGASSIAAFVNGSSAMFVRVALTAGQGARGADGVTGVRNPDGTISPANYAGTNAPAATAAGPGTTVCTFIDVATGATMTDRSSGGAGGLGSYSPETGVVAGDGLTGTSYPPPLASNPLSGDGLGGAAGVTGATGHYGQGGLARPSGIAATQSGALSATGWTPSSGGDGSAGDPGQGGGGGGGTGNEDQGFVQGGGGGAGGCGGAGGTGGGGGGASVALLSFASTVTLKSCVLRSARSGDGGAGGPGQIGQIGGSGLPIGMSPGPGSGGSGGAGAGGSGGAGGSAGVSAGILYNSNLPAFSTADTAIAFGPVGVAGAGGAPGSFVTNVRISTAGVGGAAGYLDPQGWGAYIMAP